MSGQAGSKGHRKQLGATGEAMVARYLERLGWRIVARNYRCAAGEVDLIAEEPAGEERTLVFVEVKTRRTRSCGAPVEAVTGTKQSRLIQVAQHYLACYAGSDPEPRCRFDVAAVQMHPDGTARITLIRGAFSA
ncbi:MAG: YraN family protein [Chloroherpetonaceae bacterium]|nr:YraN family protein [Chthonomonadaceae bacterium]MDW8206261.1 YraN family protein [Chloroherpetonaceae bacterium]